ncbi:protein FAM229A isoform X1 [Moschus berezovskii]|nr:protein FAM229A isoform X1 [Moschus berezovskii]
MQPSPSTPGPGRAADTCPAPPGPERPPAARARAAASSLGPASASGRAPRGLDMSAQEPPQGRRFPIEAGDSPGLAAAPESQDSPEPVATEHNPVRKISITVLDSGGPEKLETGGDGQTTQNKENGHLPRAHLILQRWSLVLLPSVL